jgi:diguanylate cyclase (GGDEF)-like protein
MRPPTLPTAAPAGRWRPIVWLLLASLIASAMWGFVIHRAKTELAVLEAGALREAAAYAEAYEQYITRSVGQMDQVTMQLKQSWEQSHGALRLEDLQRAGMFTDSAFAAVSIVDRHGKVRSATGRAATKASLAGSDFFLFHKNNNSTALRIDVPPGARAPSQDAVLFTRRLDTADDDFDGVVMVTVDAAYFTAFYIPTTLGSKDMLAMVGADGALRAEQAAGPGAGASDSRFPRDSKIWSAQRGAELVRGADGFPDGRARILGWRRSPSYPVVGLVALSHQAVLAAADAYWIASRNLALLATVCLLLGATFGSVLAQRAAARRREQDEVRRAYRTATESANDGFYMATAVRNGQDQIVDFEIVDCNERGAFFYGLERADLIGARLSSISVDVFGHALFATYLMAMESGFYEDEREMPHNNHLNIRWGRRRLVRVGNGLAITLQDISERKAHEATLLRLANEDGLTSLANRHWLMNFMPGALERATQTGARLALLFIDLDEFKYVNDSHGHAVGDQVLTAAAARLKSVVRPSDHVVRFGGDEFVVLLMSAESDALIGCVAERILSAFAAPFSVADETQRVGASIGISVFPRDGRDAGELIKHGDIAMYLGKNDGKGQYRFFDPSQANTLQTKVELRQRLVEAIEQDQFVLHYQPRVDTFTGELCSMEALLRWIDPVRGMIAPLEFIPLAESSGLIARIGEMVMQKACAQLFAWRAAGVPLVPISINVSPRQFARGEIPRQLGACLQRYEIDAALLEVEITESAMLGEQDDILAELSAIRRLGVKLHVDDFGTGYSSLSQLQKLKMDVLKVDRAFTSELGKSDEGQVFFQAIVSMAHALGMSVVAEGVETQEQLRILQTLACNEVQGYFVSRAVPPDEAEQLIRRRFLFPAARPTPPTFALVKRAAR